MKQPTAPLLGLLGITALVVALFVRAWAADRTDTTTLQLLPAAVAYALTIWGLSRLIDADPRRSLVGSVHMLLVPIVTAFVLLAVAMTAGERRLADAGNQPTWGVLLARATQHGLAAIRSAVAA